MAEESEKRFHAVMDKLFHAPRKSISQSTTTTATPSTSSSEGQVSRGIKRPNMATELSVSKSKARGSIVKAFPNSSFSRGSVQTPSCRSWDRGDLLKRLATFKSMTWFAKPQVVNALNCARRGWVNVDVDTIACEACGARLFFSTPSVWMQHQVEKAASVFSLKLDNGHKLFCPWIDNACEETLAQFPPTPAEVLVDEYKQRLSALLHLLALPVISASAINCTRNTLLKHFLGGPVDIGCSDDSADASCSGLGNDDERKSSLSYYKAQKLVSLCGWEPRLLPYIVDCKSRQNESIKDANNSDLFRGASNDHRSSLMVYSSGIEANIEANNNSVASCRVPCDPSSVVLDCRLCGASVGLWAFSTVPRPLELLRVVGYTEVNGGRDSANHKENAICGEIGISGTRDLGNVNHRENRQSMICTTSSIVTSSIERKTNLNLTIAGGPPPTKQNFRATISLPVIGRNLRARLSSDLDSRNISAKNFSLEGEIRGESTLTGIGFQPEDKDLRHGKQVDDGLELPETSVTVSLLEVPIPNAPSLVDSSNKDNKLPEKAGNIASPNPEVGVGNVSQAGECSVAATSEHVTIRNEKNIEDDASVTVEANSSNFSRIPVSATVCSPEGHSHDGEGVMVRAQPLSNDVLPSKIGKCAGLSIIPGKDLSQPPLGEAMEFDPIRQHRPFCPWIASINNSLPGWEQALSALHRLEEFSCPSSEDAPSSSLIEVDDPITSIRKLFTPPSTKRMKLAHDSSGSTIQF